MPIVLGTFNSSSTDKIIGQSCIYSITVLQPLVAENSHDAHFL